MKFNRVYFWAVLAAASFLLGWLWAGKAQSATMTRRCVIANQDCFVLRGKNAEKRMSLVNDRLAYILGCEDLKDLFTKNDGHGNVAIYVGHSLLVTVSPADAQAAGADSPSTLANIWMKNLESAFSVEMGADANSPTEDEDDSSDYLAHHGTETR